MRLVFLVSLRIWTAKPFDTQPAELPKILRSSLIHLTPTKTIMATNTSRFQSPGLHSLDKSKTATGLVDVKLSNNFGKTNTVLLFFPLAYTSVCTAELCDVTNGLGAFPGADFIAISVDSPFAQEAWAKTNNIQVRLASDLNKVVIKQYDVVFPMLAGVTAHDWRARRLVD